MTPERTVQLVARWVRFYTRDLPDPIAQRRVDEIDADLHDHVAHERANGMSDRRIARGIASRVLRGLAADLAWRRGQPKLVHPSMRRSAVRVALGVALILALPLVATLVTDGVSWKLGDFVVAAVLLTVIGIALELAVRKAGNRVTAVGIAALGVAAGILGLADDAPGLVLLGILLVVSACAIGARIAQRSR